MLWGSPEEDRMGSKRNTGKMRRVDISEMRNQRYKIRIYRDKFNDLIHYGDDNNSVIDKISAFLLAISPILQHYQGFYINAGYSVLLIISPYILLKLLEKIFIDKIRKVCFNLLKLVKGNYN